MKKRSLLCILFILSFLLSACNIQDNQKSSEQAEGTEDEIKYTLDYMDEIEAEAEPEEVEASYFESILDSYHWGMELKPLRMLPEFDASLYSFAITSLMTSWELEDGYWWVLKTGCSWVGKTFYGANETFSDGRIKYDPTVPGRMMLVFQCAGGSCTLRLMGKDGNIIWEKEHANQYFTEYLELEGVPEGVALVVEDTTAEEDAEKLRYALDICVAVKKEGIIE